MLRTFRAKVDDDGAIRLFENEDLPVGREVLVTVLERHQLLPLMGPNGEIRMSEEQQRIEDEETAYWAEIFKDLPSI